ncbi:hypothetical protein BL250_04730 [Erwinia sp. OLTSP20]|nr:hypothetical protein BV501_00705 [Erwinia sp. OAMSP11]PIJ75686.1 hypothetical protein BK416_00815 [Erwinia sp. OLSSP12]PIJ83647.1 hypothetical protein BLD46_09285 [Erwinia sp. OLMTSP26]PIJ84278.1 hypothetical protein BLD47_02750 [Erwinia sp. OLCASP19]PIJ88743.1 hypothetical protein BLD49_01060 [Erwinia sp. OLMDSP33]PIJ90339.1 hypothetical protein BL249_13350 [Erwinia sp. OLFS4]PIJ93989.1 hypothetical protein BL250_04730 [Erwinia sp. OLTSP20]
MHVALAACNWRDMAADYRLTQVNQLCVYQRTLTAITVRTMAKNTRVASSILCSFVTLCRVYGQVALAAERDVPFSLSGCLPALIFPRADRLLPLFGRYCWRQEAI